MLKLPSLVGYYVNSNYPTLAGMSLVPLIACRLRELRQLHGLTQQEFAEVAGVGFKFYQQLESGRKKQIWLETVERIAAPYGLEAWQFIAPSLPKNTRFERKINQSSVHYLRRRGPYGKNAD